LRIDGTSGVFVCFVLANLLFWPVFTLLSPLELPLAAYVRGFTGELSITSMLLLWAAYFSPKEIHIPASDEGLDCTGCPCFLSTCLGHRDA
jgi:hypothetical protein